MNKRWLLSVLFVSIALLTVQKGHEIKSAGTYFKAEKTLKLRNFQEAQKKIPKEDLPVLKLWESILTGRSAPLSKIMKANYKSLGLNHIFTPSGFHLSAVLFPFMKFVKNIKLQLLLILVVGGGLFFLPGLGALKRMVLIKANQNILGTHIGFIAALLLDMFFGTFQNSALSFTYSFLFLGIIYSGLTGLGLIVWFFIAQMLLAYFQSSDISLLLLFFSPVLNFSFAILMPVLFLLSIPLWNWQLHTGIFLLKNTQRLVDFLASVSFKFPTLEVSFVTLLIVGLILVRRWRPVLVLIFLFCNSLNLDYEKNPGLSTNEYVPQGKVLKTIYKPEYVRVVMSDGSCKLKLVRGFWWENCSPRRGSSRKKKIS